MEEVLAGIFGLVVGILFGFVLGVVLIFNDYDQGREECEQDLPRNQVCEMVYIKPNLEVNNETSK